jgi:hypothetical protein
MATAEPYGRRPYTATDVQEVREWGSKQEGLNGTQAMYLFKQLVEEGYISVSSMQKIDELPWIVAFPQALTTKGLLEISELPDSNARLLGSLNAIKDAIARLNVDDQQKSTAMKAAEELRGFLQQLPREVAVDLAKTALIGLARGSGMG